MATGAESRSAPTILGHPRGLFLLFFVEMWERFSYYGMRALLIFYLTKHFLFSDEKAYLIYGAYTALVFITPLIGGYVADRYLGARKAVLFGGVLLSGGHLLMGIEGSGGADPTALAAFYLALSLIIVGVGFLKANVAVLVGHLYPRDDIRRDPAFTLFYIGINAGAALGPLVCGLLGEVYGWQYGFGAAGVGMVVGLAAFIGLRPLLDGKGEPPRPERLREKPFAGISREWLIYLLTFAAVPLVWLLMAKQEVVSLILIAASVIAVGMILHKALFRLERADRNRLLLALFLIVVQPLFWGLYEQTGSSLNLFTDRHVDRRMFGVEVPASLFLSLTAIYIVLIAPFFAWLWTALGRRGLEPSTPAKFGLALIQIGAGFLVLVAGANAAGVGPTPVIFIFLLYLLHVTGELCLSPVGVSAMTRLAVPEMVGLLMGTWYLATAGGNYIASLIARATGDAGEGSAAAVVAVYGQIGWFAVGVGVAVLLIAPFVARLDADRC